jgi:hypothetical protein
LEYHIVSTLYTEENDTPITWAPSPLTGVHIVSSQTTHPSHGHPHPTQGHTQRPISVSERNDTPISWAHPTHGLSHRLTHLVCVLEDVSRSCNHQHSQPPCSPLLPLMCFPLPVLPFALLIFPLGAFLLPASPFFPFSPTLVSNL